jgi:hypothetical protein
MDSPYYSESELCGGAVTVSFSKYLPFKVGSFSMYTLVPPFLPVLEAPLKLSF